MAHQSTTSSTGETRWLLRECGGCGASFRIRRGLRDASIECPFCDAPTESPVEEESSPPSPAPRPARNAHAAEKPAQRSPNARIPPPRREVAGAQSAFGNGAREALPRDAPTAPADPPPMSPPSPRVAIARARPLSTAKLDPARRARKPSPRSPLWITLGAAALLLCAAAIVAVLLSLFGAGSPAVADVPPAADIPESPAVPPPASAGGSILLESDCQAALESLRQCFGADTVEGMLPFVRHPEKVRPLMEKWYQSHPLAPLDLRTLVRARLMEVHGGVRLLVLDIEDGSGKSAYYVVEQTPDAGMKVDWEVSARYQEMPLREFQETRPMRSIPFRVHAMLSDYYNYEYHDSDRYLCVALSYPGDPTFKLWGYAERASPVGVRLGSLLEFGSDSLILDLCYPEGPQAQSSEQARITDLRQSSWFR